MTERNPSSAILVVDDNQAQLKSLADILECEGFRPVCCETGGAGIAACRDHAVQAAVLDLRLPDMDGLEVLAELKRVRPEIKVIIHTAFATMECAMEAVNREAFAFVNKTAGPEELLRHIHRAVRAHYMGYSARLEAEVRKRTRELEDANASLVRTVASLKQAEQALINEKEKSDRFLELAGTMFIGLDVDGRVIMANQKACDVLGCAAHEIKGRYWFDAFIPEKVKDEMRWVFNQLLKEKNGAAQYYENLVKTADGREKLIAWHNTVIHDDAGRVSAVVASGENITERYKNEIALLESEERYRALFDNMGDGVAIYKAVNDGEDFVFIDFNKAGEYIDGVAREELIGRRLREIFPGAENLGLFHVLQRVWKTGKAESLPAGQYIDGKISGWRENFVYKLPSGEIVAIYSDETDKKIAEEHTSIALAQLEEKVAEIEALYLGTKLILEDVDFASTARELFDICMDLTGSAAGYLSLLDEKCAESEMLFFEGGGAPCGVKPEAFVLAGGLRDTARRTGDTVFENNFRESPQAADMPDGHIPLENVLFAPLTIDGATLGLMGMGAKPGGFTDNDAKLAKAFGELAAIALRNSLAKKNIQEKEKQLRQTQKLEAIGALAGGIAHDFNNILFPLLGYTEMLLDDLPEGDPKREKVLEIFSSASRARDLVRQILTFSRQSDQEVRPLNPQLVLKEVVKLIRSTLPSTIQLTQDIDPETAMIMADPTHFHQIAMNLITNAYHAMEAGGGELAVRLKNAVVNGSDEISPALLPGNYMRLTIEDTGEGIPEKAIERIFNPYYTTKPQGKGTGLGLSIVHGLVKNYKGDITVRSVAGQGTVFDVYIPGLAVKSRSDAAADANIRPLRKGHERILLVDDEEPVVKLESQMLARLGYAVETKTGSLDALAAFKSEPHAYDLVITDLTMPAMTGTQLAANLMKIRPDIPVIICTGFSEKLSAEKCEAMGVKGLLLKPVVRSDMADLIRKSLDENKTPAPLN